MRSERDSGPMREKEGRREFGGDKEGGKEEQKKY